MFPSVLEINEIIDIWMITFPSVLEINEIIDILRFTQYLISFFSLV